MNGVTMAIGGKPESPHKRKDLRHWREARLRRLHQRFLTTGLNDQQKARADWLCRRLQEEAA